MKLMKKFLSLMIVVVALFACQDLSAQKNKIVGKWQADAKESALFVEALRAEGMECDGVMMFEFKKNGTGEFICDVSTSGPMEEGVTLVMDIILKVDIKWTYKNDLLSVEYTAADVNFKRLTVEPADPEFDAFFAQLKPMMEQKMAEELLASTKDNDDSAHVEFVDNNNVILHAFIDGIDLAIERVK